MAQLQPTLKEEINKVRRMTDGMGRLVDEGIILTVAALRCHGFTTTASCGGHAERASAPWIDIESSESGPALKTMQEGPHSGPEFLKNRQDLIEVNRQENCRLFMLLEAFYGSRSASYSTMLTVAERGPGYGRLSPHASYLVGMSAGRYDAWLGEAQAEMTAFGEWLAQQITA